MVILVSKDGDEIPLDTQLARHCKTLADVIDISGDEAGQLKIPVAEVTTPVLKDIVTFLEYHASNPYPEFTPEDRYKCVLDVFLPFAQR